MNKAEKGCIQGGGPSGSTRLKKLGDIHRQAALLLLQGGSAQSVADVLEVSPNTIASWKRSPRFKRHFRKLRRDAFDDAVAILQAASKKAVAVIVALLDAGQPQPALEADERPGRPDLALQAAFGVLKINDRWLENVDVVERVEELEQMMKKNRKDK